VAAAIVIRAQPYFAIRIEDPTMNGIQRYQANAWGERESGSWVRYSDYAALASVVYEVCSKQGCFCVTDPPLGECPYCILGAALKGFVPDASSLPRTGTDSTEGKS
jgi:hypothetical protein